jgi:hypothetical protein
MAGIGNNTVFGNGFRLEPSASTDISDMQATANDISFVNFTGSPNGNVSANPSSMCHNPSTGDLYVKSTGTGNTGWSLISNAGSTVTSVTGTANRITSTGGTTPQIDIDAAYVGQTSITTLGTITTGTWQGTAVGTAFGGLGHSQVATATGAILRADGTNWSATTSTYPNTNAINTLLYAASANVMAALATANSGVLTTSTSGVPSIDTTNFQVLTTGVQMKGNNTNTAPPAGFIGEQIRATVAAGSAVNLTNLTQTNITSISLTAGIWDASCVCIFNPNATYTGSFVGVSISTTSATPGTAGDNAATGNPPAANVYPVTQVIPSYRITLASTTTVYMVGVASVTAGACTAYGRISATRVG